MPRNQNGTYTIPKEIKDGEYLKTSWMQSILKDVEVALNGFWIKGINKFINTITVNQITNVVTGTLSNSAVAYTTPTNYNIPVNAIVMYSKKNLSENGMPVNFRICDGTKDTPKLPLGADFVFIKRIS